MGKEGVILEHVADIPMAGRNREVAGGIEEYPLSYHDPTLIRGHQSRHGLQGEAFPRAGRTEQGDDVFVRGKGDLQVKDPSPCPQLFFDINQDFHA
jgi:hypothetical protein